MHVFGIVCISEPTASNDVKTDHHENFVDITTNPMAEDDHGGVAGIEILNVTRSSSGSRNKNQYARLTDTSIHASSIDTESKSSEGVLQSDNSTVNSTQTQSSGSVVDYTTWQVLQLPITYHIMTCYVMSTVGGLFWIGTLKTFANTYFNDEAYLVTVFSCGSLFSCLGRITWGVFSDRIGSTNALMFINALFMLINYTYPLITGSKGLFAIWTFITFFCEGGIFILYLPLTIALFGHKHSTSNYGVIFASHTLFAVANILLMSHYDVSFSVVCMLIGTLGLCATANIYVLSYHIQYFKGNL
ncbi:hypothetical protein EON63_00045 [archaeon]|nr:MAG: hypothetical protein EON63_00045 [archaeon]